MNNTQAIIKNIENGFFRVVQNPNGRSPVWNKFHLIETEDKSILKGTVWCVDCKKLLHYNGKQTTNLLRHRCVADAREEVQDSREIKEVSNEEKEKLLDSLIQWMTEDCRPYAIVEGTGFKELAQAFINIGAKFGRNVNLSTMMPDARTVYRRVNLLATESKEDMRGELQTALAHKNAAVTCKLWTDNYIQRHLLCATFHFSNSREIKELVLGVKSLDFEQCTTEHILKQLTALLADFGINELERIVFVTDKNSNLVEALKYHRRINCAHHLLNDVLDAALARTEELDPIFKACVKLVVYLRISDVEQMLPSAFDINGDARWKSLHNISKSITSNWSEIYTILTQMDGFDRITSIPILQLNRLLELFENFDIVSNKLQGKGYVTINYVYLSINSLRTICKSYSYDDDVIVKFKANVISEMEAKWIPNLSIYHKVACFLYPPTNSLLKDDTLTEAKQYCMTQIQEYENVTNTMSVTVKSEPETETNESDQRPTEFDIFFSTLLEPQPTEVEASNEVERYSLMKVQIDVNFDPLQWWESHATLYPKLSKLANKVFSIPASSASSDRVFASVANMISEKRYCLEPKVMSNMLFLNCLNGYE